MTDYACWMLRRVCRHVLQHIATCTRQLAACIMVMLVGGTDVQRRYGKIHKKAFLPVVRAACIQTFTFYVDDKVLGESKTLQRIAPPHTLSQTLTFCQSRKGG